MLLNTLKNKEYLIKKLHQNLKTTFSYLNEPKTQWIYTLSLEGESQQLMHYLKGLRYYRIIFNNNQKIGTDSTQKNA